MGKMDLHVFEIYMEGNTYSDSASFNFFFLLKQISCNEIPNSLCWSGRLVRVRNLFELCLLLLESFNQVLYLLVSKLIFTLSGYLILLLNCVI